MIELAWMMYGFATTLSCVIYAMVGRRFRKHSPLARWAVGSAVGFALSLALPIVVYGVAQ